MPDPCFGLAHVMRHPNEQDVSDTSFLPRGPKVVAAAVDFSRWHARWVVSSGDDGTPSIGVAFQRHDRSRRGWAVWIDGKYSGGFLYPGPQRLNARQLRETLAG